MKVKYFIPVLILTLFFFKTDLFATGENVDGPFSFVVLGHLRGSDNGEMNYLIDEVIADVRKLNPDMVFLTGDLIWGYHADAEVVRNDWKQLDSKLEQIGVPIYRVPGNHDINDPVTRDIYFERYGELPQDFTYHGCLFILLNSAYVPKGDTPEPYKSKRSKQLDSNQTDFIRERLSLDNTYSHVFLFMHHILWWPENAPWWRDVHPLLVGKNVRAVFGGDLGPMKFSHMRREGVDYIQSAIENEYAIENKDSLKYLHAKEGNRIVALRFDNFLYVTVDGPQVDIEVKTIGAMSSGKYSLRRWQEIYGPIRETYKPAIIQEEPLPVSEKHSFMVFMRRLWEIIESPKRLMALVVVMWVCFLSGMVAARVWGRRKA